MRFGSLFAGIGGFDLGLERAGMECVWQVEKNEFCTKVLEKHWPDVERFGDIRDVGSENLTPVDLICGGFPCQPFSVAGKRQGEDDDRYLWPEMCRVIAELRPTWVLGENVAGIVRMALDTVLSDLEDLDYVSTTFNIPACAVGAPHQRKRIWIVAHTDSPRQHEPARKLVQGRLWFGLKSKRSISDSNRDSLRDQPGRSRGQNGKDQTITPDLSEDVAHSDGERPQTRRNSGEIGESTGEIFSWATTDGSSEARNVGNSSRSGRGRYDGRRTGQESENRCENVADSFSRYTRRDQVGGTSWAWWWEREPLEVLQHARERGGEEDVLPIPESLLGRVANGVPNRVDRLKSLGNAVVPQIVEVIGRAIIDTQNAQQGGE